MSERDFLDKMIDKRAARNPSFRDCWTRLAGAVSCCVLWPGSVRSRSARRP